MAISAELAQVMELVGMALGLVLTVLILLVAIGSIAGRFVDVNL